jgi:uncharacterized protein YhfF
VGVIRVLDCSVTVFLNPGNDLLDIAGDGDECIYNRLP